MFTLLSKFQLTASQGGWRYVPGFTFLVVIFQLTASQGGWHMDDLEVLRYNLFQLTASQGGWLVKTETEETPISDFNSQPHKEADDRNCYPVVWWKFQLTASQGGWLLNGRVINRAMKFQLTASQGGWRTCTSFASVPDFISTHSLTRRLTSFLYSSRLIVLFQLTASQGGWRSADRLHRRLHPHFNSQPHKEADGDDGKPIDVGFLFQLTASQGGWRRSKIWRKNAWKISTHSLTRRLTLIAC